MNFIIHQAGNLKIAELDSRDMLLKETGDFLDLMANADYVEADAMIIRKSNTIQEFFDLKTGIAGEILQKFSTYRKKLAIIGDYTDYSSESLKAFIRESNRSGRIYFVDSLESAIGKLKAD